MKKLTRIKLVNWHYFGNETIDVNGSFLLSGENASGKSTILDAIQLILTTNTRRFNPAANEKSKANNDCGAVAIELADGTIVTGKNSEIMSASAACVFNAVKVLAGINDSVKLISPYVIGPILDLKTKILKDKENTLTLDEALIALSICAATDVSAARATEKLVELEGCEAHSSHMLYKADENPFRKLGLNLTCEPEFLDNNLFNS